MVMTRSKAALVRGNTPTLGGLNITQKDLEKFIRLLEACGAYETYTYSFVSPTDVKRIGLEAEHPLSKQLSILNPLGEEYSKCVLLWFRAY